MKNQPGDVKNENESVSYNHKSSRKLYALLAIIVFAGAIFAVSKLTSNNKPAAPAVRPPVVAVVHITKSGFQPASLSVKQGTRVIWENDDQSLHQVAANPYPKGTSLPALKSEILNNTQTYTYTANTIGSFGYHDQMQPTVNGSLVVQKQ